MCSNVNANESRRRRFCAIVSAFSFPCLDTNLYTVVGLIVDYFILSKHSTRLTPSHDREPIDFILLNLFHPSDSIPDMMREI